MKNHEKPTWNDEKPWKPTFSILFPYFSPFSPILCKIFCKKSKVQFFLLARAIHREHFLLHCLKKQIATAKELDLRQLGKVLIFRDRQLLLYINPGHYHNLIWFYNVFHQLTAKLRIGPHGPSAAQPAEVEPRKIMKNQPGTMKNHNHHWIWVSWAKWSFFVTAPIIYKSQWWLWRVDIAFMLIMLVVAVVMMERFGYFGMESGRRNKFAAICILWVGSEIFWLSLMEEISA